MTCRFLVAALLGMTRTAAAQQPATRFVLPNGLRVWIAEDHSRPVALVHITYRAGSINESAGMTGVAHYVEHMVYRATQHVRNEDVYGYIDRIGGRYTGGTWPEFTRYAELVPSFAVESALRVTADRMCCALFDSTEFERERGNVGSETNGYADADPMSAFQDALLQATFTLHPYRYNSDTWARDNLLLTRDEAFEWYRAHYGPNNAVLVIAGDVNSDDVRRMVEKHFADVAPAPVSGRVTAVEPPQRAERRVTYAYPDRTPALRGVQQLELLFHAPNGAHSDFGTLVVTDHLLRPLIEQRLAGISSTRIQGKLTTVDSASQYPYVYRITFKTDTSTDLDRVRAAIQWEIARLGSTGPTDAEVTAARRAAARYGALADAEYSNRYGPPRRSYLSRIAEDVTAREALPWDVTATTLDSVRARIARVSAADVRAFARDWLRPSQATIGFLVPGGDGFVPAWTDGRPVAGSGDHVDIPAQATMPAKRLRPDPVPAEALRPLAPLALRRERRQVRNGVVVRWVPTPDSTFIRVDYAGGPSDAAEIERRLRARLGSARRIQLVNNAAREDTSAAGLARERVLAAVDPGAHGALRALTVSIVGASAAADADIAASALATMVTSDGRGGARNASVVEERIAKPGEVQVEIVAGLPGVGRRDRDRRALELLDYIVGVPSYGGRFGWALTKAGLAYYAAVKSEVGNSGHILITTTSNPHNTNAVIQAIREVITGVGERGVEEWELREAQAFMLGRTLLYGARDNSTPDAIAGALAESEVADVELLDLPALSRAYLDVTLDDINRVARTYYRPERLKVVAVGAIPSPTEKGVYPPGTFRAIFEP